MKYRVKEFKSFEEKLVNKRYAHPQDMTDFAALRVICYLKRDVQEPNDSATSGSSSTTRILAFVASYGSSCDDETLYHQAVD
jgi:ppGpp synthetase/RelA/SpoT-type nucleotidyltranferase